MIRSWFKLDVVTTAYLRSERQDRHESIHGHRGPHGRAAFFHARSRIILLGASLDLHSDDGPDANSSQSKSKDANQNAVSSRLRRADSDFEQWNCIKMASLATAKKGLVIEEGDFLKSTKQSFTSYYQPLIPWVHRLRRVVFPDGKRWHRQDAGLYARMKEICREAQSGDPQVLAADGLA